MAQAGITIDADSTRDIDDGIWIETTDDGWLVTVAIADVASSVHLGSSFDTSAREAVASKYFPTGNKPMLPRKLSEGDLSLHPGETRKVVLTKIRIPKAQLPKLELLELGEFKSIGRLSYDQIPEVLSPKARVACNHSMQSWSKKDGQMFCGDCEAPITQDPETGFWYAHKTGPERLVDDEILSAVRTISSVSDGLLSQRRDRGALVIYDVNDGWVTTEEGYLKQLKDTRETIGYIIVQEMMILTNALVAEWCVQQELPVLYRNHTARLAAPEREELVQQLREATTGPWQTLDATRQRIRMLLDRADYGAVLKGHYGLNLPAYLHFTSPIRRYADLVNHRQIRARLLGETVPYSPREIEELAQHINSAETAERTSTSAYFKTRAETKAEKSLERGQLRKMTDKEFERALKVETRLGQDARETLQEVFLSRLGADVLPTICMAVVTFFPDRENAQPGWRRMQEALLAYTVEHPEVAVAIWTMGLDIASGHNVSPIEWLESRSGPPHASIFEAKGVTEGLNFGPFYSGITKATTAKQARQWATVRILAEYLGLPKPEFGMNLPTVEQDQPTKSPLVDLASGRDPIVALQEYAQKHKLTLPVYAYKVAGLSHLPNITCTCSFSGRTGVGEAASKKEAKRLAAGAVVQRFLEEIRKKDAS